jgi:RNA polymerase sigma-70 factor (ECF subfamily)
MQEILELPAPATSIGAAEHMREFERIHDRELLRRFHAGDHDAFTEVYRAQHRSVFRFALFMTADESRAVEVTQDVFVWLIHHPEDFDPERGDLGSFLIGVTRKILQRRFSDEKRWVALDQIAEPSSPINGERGGDVATLRQAVQALPLRYREVVVLCDLEENTYEQAASSLACAVGTVRSRLHRARTLLARKLLGKGCAV